MNDNLMYHAFKTRLGWIACLASPAGLVRITLPCESRETAVREVGKGADAVRSPEAFALVEAELMKYCEGHRPDFSAVALDLSGGTPFRRQVWSAIRSIPYGETRSYGWIAQKAGKPAAARAAGQAVGDNPFAIIVPCHRVIASDGALCGFGGGLDMKRKLLELEGVALQANSVR
jgi:methylated-DNA-[protein]-cysteine S-methyltransferase